MTLELPVGSRSVVTLGLQPGTTRNLLLHGAVTISDIETTSDQKLMLMGQLDDLDLRTLRSLVALAHSRRFGEEERVVIPDHLQLIPIAQLGFSSRSANVLSSYGCRVLAHLAGISLGDLVRLKNLGRGSAEDILTLIRELSVEGAAPQATPAVATPPVEPPAPTKLILPDLPEGCWDWSPANCKPLASVSELFEEMEAETLGDLLTTLSDHVIWSGRTNTQTQLEKLTRFLEDVARAVIARTLAGDETRYVPPMTTKLALHATVSACTTADAEFEVLHDTVSQHHRDSVLARWTTRAGRSPTLNEIAVAKGVTRERIRQVVDTAKNRLLEVAIRLPRLSQAVVALGAVRTHWTLSQAEEFLRGIGNPVSERTLRVLPALAEIAAVHAVEIDAHDLIVVESGTGGGDTAEDVSADVKDLLATIRIAGWVAEDRLPANSASEAIVLRRLQPGVRALVRVGNCVLPQPGLDVSCVRWVVKVLHVMGRQQLSVLHDRMKGFENNSYGERLRIAYPDAHAFAEMLRLDSRFVVDEDSAGLRPELDDDDPLTPTERSVLGALEMLGGTAKWNEILSHTREHGFAQATVTLVLQSPLVDHRAHATYSLPSKAIIYQDQAKNVIFNKILTNTDTSHNIESVANDPVDAATNLEPFGSPSLSEPTNSRRQDTSMAAPMPASDRGTLTLPALALTQDRHRIFLTAIRAEDLQEYTRIDHFKPALPTNDPKQGYQRTEDTPRIKKLGNWLRKQLDESRGVLMPTAILTSTRDARLSYDPERRTVTIHKDAKLWVVDGQHRRAGLNYAIHEKGRDDLRSFEVPLVIVEDLSREQEMTQFAVVNGNQKGVRTDLVNMILTQLTSSRGDEAIEERDQWRVVVSRTVTALNQTSGGPWEDLIVMPNEKGWTASEIAEDPTREHQRVVRATSFMTSLRPIYDYLNASFFSVEDLTTTQRAERLTEVVAAFWEAIRDLNPQPFEEAGLFVLQKTPGAFALHRLCARLMPAMHNARREWDRENFRIMLEPIGELADPMYWDVKSGEASKYGSMKGFAELADNLMESRKSGI